MSKIEWTNETWNPVVGCSVLSPGCTNCYAMRMAARIEAMGSAPHYVGTTKRVNGKAVWTGKLALASEDTMIAPLRWREPRRIFVNSMSDLFHENMPDEWIAEVFGVMAVGGQPFHGPGDGAPICGYWTASSGQRHPYRFPNLKHGPHVFQVLTKRAARARRLLNCPSFRRKVASAAYRRAHNRIDAGGLSDRIQHGDGWPLPNVWLGVSAERQPEYDERWSELRQTPAAVRFISFEPLLGPIECGFDLDGLPAPGWAIVGGESGPGARPFDLDWARSIIAQCRGAGAPCFVKQIGSNPTLHGFTGMPIKDKKGGDPAEWPDDLRVRQYPERAA